MYWNLRPLCVFRHWICVTKLKPLVLKVSQWEQFVLLLNITTDDVEKSIFDGFLALSINPIHDEPFWGCWRVSGAKCSTHTSPPPPPPPLLLKICHSYLTIMNLGILTAYLENIQKISTNMDIDWTLIHNF